MKAFILILLLFSCVNSETVKWGTEVWESTVNNFYLDFGRQVNVTKVYGVVAMMPRQCCMNSNYCDDRTWQTLITLSTPSKTLDQSLSSWSDQPANYVNQEIDPAIYAVILKIAGKTESVINTVNINTNVILDTLILNYVGLTMPGSSLKCFIPNAEAQLVIEYYPI